MITVIQGLKDHKVQIALNGALLYEFSNSIVELKDCYLLVKYQGQTLITLMRTECEWFMVIETL